MTQILATTVAPLAPGAKRSRRRRGDASTVIGLTMLAVVLSMIVITPFTPVFDPFTQDLAAARMPLFASTEHLLGTDSLGRDVLSRLSLAGLMTVGIAILVVIVNVIIGVTVGLVSGYRGGWVDNALGTLSETQLAIPVVILLVALSAVFGPGTQLMVIVLCLTYWVGYARVTRTLAISLRDRDFVIAPLTQGGTHGRTVFSHVLPHVVPQIIVVASFDIAVIVAIGASLDYLGLGIQPPIPSWGSMITEGQKYLQSDPQLVLLPGIALFLFVGSIQLLSQRFTAENTMSGKARA